MPSSYSPQQQIARASQPVDAGAARSSPPPSFLATPLGLSLIIPLLVGAAALGALIPYHFTLQAGMREQARERIAADARVVRERALQGLGQVAALVDGLHAWADRAGSLDDPAQVARALIAMADARPGVSQVYLGRPDGGLIGITLAEGTWQSLTVAPGANGMRRTLGVLDAEGRIRVTTVEENVAYDARVQPWYRQAVATPGRSWTPPYRFARTGTPGVTVAHQLAPSTAGQPPRGVVAVDLDLASFGGFLQRPGDLGRNLVFDRERALIATPPGLVGAFAGSGLPSGADATDAVVRAFFTAIPALPAGDSILPVRVAVEGQDHGGFVQPLAVPGGPTWYLAQITSRDAVLGIMDQARFSAVLVASAVVVIGILAGLSFARLLAGARREVEHQRDRAQNAEAKVRELGSYTLVRKIGEGGMGQVWIGEHRMLSRPAAIKLIQPETLAGTSPEEVAQARQRFEREARITASLRARSTVELYDYGISPDGTFFYVMELLDGLDLRALVERHGRQPAGRVVRILVDALASLAEAHDRGLVHRDIKPENIFVCRRADEVDVVKVLDFGLVRQGKAAKAARLTADGMVSGTPTTMAPEQAMGQDLDGRTDLYALGCVACWLLTGEEVFSGDNPYELLNLHINQPPRPLDDRNPAVPVALARLVEQCLAKDPARRPSDARALARDLATVEIPPDQAWTAEQATAWWTRVPTKS